MSTPTVHGHQASTLDEFISELRALSADDIRAYASQLSGTEDSLRWWRSTIEVERRLHDARLSRVAAAAATAARNAVLSRAAGIEVHDGDIVTVSRAAADAARGLVAGCHLTGAYPFALSCEPGASPDTTAAERPRSTRRQAA